MAKKSSPLSPTADHSPAIPSESGSRDSKRRSAKVDRVRLNTVLIVATFGLLVVLGGTVHVFHGLSVQRTANTYLLQATQAEKQQEYAAALGHYARYLGMSQQVEFTAGLTNSLVRLGKRDISNKVSPHKLVDFYATALRIAPDNRPLRESMVEACGRIGNHREAIEHLEKLLAVPVAVANKPAVAPLTDLETSRLLSLKGQHQAAHREPETSQASLVEAISLAPERIMVYSQLAEVIMANQENLLHRDELPALKTPWPDLVAAFPEKVNGREQKGRAVALRTALVLYRLATKQPTQNWLAWRNLASFLANGAHSADEPPVDAGNELEQAKNSFDTDGDRLVSTDEMQGMLVSGYADTNFNGSVSPDEFENVLVEGERWTRLNSARLAIDKAKAALPADLPAARGLVALKEAEILSLIGVTTIQQSRLDDRNWLGDSLKAAQAGSLLGLDWRDFRFNEAVVHRQLAEVATSKTGKLDRLSESERLLRELRAELDAEAKAEAEKSAKPAPVATGPVLSEVVELDSLDSIVTQIRISTDPEVFSVEQQLAEVLSRKVNFLSGAEAAAVQAEVQKMTRAFEAMTQRMGGKQYGDLLRCQQLVQDRNWGTAAQELLQLQYNLPPNATSTFRIRILELRTLCAWRLSNFQLTVDLANELLQFDPNSPLARYYLGYGLLGIQETDEALRQFADCLNIPGVFEQSISVMVREIMRAPADTRDWTPVEKLIARVENRPDHELGLAFARSELALGKATTLAEINGAKEGLTSELLNASRKMFQDAVARHPEDTQLIQFQVNFLARCQDLTPQQRFQECQTALKAWPEAQQNTAAHLLSRIEMSRLLTKPEALAWLQNMNVNLDQHDLEQKITLLGTLADAYWVQGDRLKAIELLGQVTSLDEFDITSRVKLLEFLRIEEVQQLKPLTGELKTLRDQVLARVNVLEQATGNGSTSGAQFAYHSGVKDFFEIFLKKVPFNELSTEDKARLVKARGMLQTAAQQSPSLIEPQKHLADLEAFMGNREQGIVHARKAFDLGERNEILLYQLAAYYLQPGRIGMTNASTVNAGSSTDPLDRARVQRSEAAPIIREAMKLPESSALRSQIIIMALNAAFQPTGLEAINAALSDFGLAENIFDTSIEAMLRDAADKNPVEGGLLLISYLTNTGRLLDAQEAVAKYEPMLPATPPQTRPLVLALWYDQLSRADAINKDAHREKAIANYRKLIELKPLEGQLAFLSYLSRQGNPDAESQEIQKTLASSLDLSTEVRQQLQRRQLQLAAVTGDVQSAAQALKSLRTLSPSSNEERVRILVTELAVLSKANRPADRPRIIKLLEELQQLQGEKFPDAEAFLLANMYVMEKSPEQAELVFRRLIRQSALRSMDPLILFELVLERIRQKDKNPEALKQADEVYRRLADADPKSYLTIAAEAELLFALGDRDRAVANMLQHGKRILQAPQLQDAFQSEVLKDVTADLPKTLQFLSVNRDILKTKDVEELLNRAQKQLAEGLTHDVKLLLQKIVDNERNMRYQDIEVVFNCAQHLEGFKALVEAEELYRGCAPLGIAPAFNIRLAQFYSRHNRYEEGMAECERLLASTPLEFVAAAATTLMQKQNPYPIETARIWVGRLATELTTCAPDRVPGLLTFAGQLCVTSGAYPEAINFYQDLLKLRPDDVSALNNLAWLHGRASGSPAEGLPLIDRAIAKHGTDPNLLDTKAIVLLGMGNTDEALAAINTVTEKDIPGLYLRRAEIQLKTGRPEIARQTALKATELGLNSSTLDAFDREVLKQALGQ